MSHRKLPWWGEVRIRLSFAFSSHRLTLPLISPQLLIQMSLLGMSIGAMLFVVKALDPYKEQKVRHAASLSSYPSHHTHHDQEAAKKKVALMKKRLGRDIELNEYEVMLAANVVNPLDITIGPDDICGLDELKHEVVRKIIVPMQQVTTFSTTLLKPVRLNPSISTLSPHHLEPPPLNLIRQRVSFFSVLQGLARRCWQRCWPRARDASSSPSPPPRSSQSIWVMPAVL